MNIDVNHYKEILQKEKKVQVLTDELNAISNPNKHNPDDWESKKTSTKSNENLDRAQEAEKYYDTEAIVSTLEDRLKNVKRALEKIKEGTYGVCDKSGKNISKKRLDANPAAVMCIDHADE